MNELDAIIFEIENFKKQMALLFILASQDQRDQMLEELNELLTRRDKLIEERKKDE